jgi:hypothetical protein
MLGPFTWLVERGTTDTKGSLASKQLIQIKVIRLQNCFAMFKQCEQIFLLVYWHKDTETYYCTSAKDLA